MNVNDLINDCKKQIELFRIECNQTRLDKSIQYISIELNLSSMPDITPADTMEHIYWHRPEMRHEILALGSAYEYSTAGKNRFDQVKQEYQSLCCKYKAANKTSPMVFIAFAFDAEAEMDNEWQDIPNMLLNLPKIIINKTQDNVAVIFNVDMHEAIQKQLGEFKSLLEKLFSTAYKNTNEDGFSIDKEYELTHKQSWMSMTRSAIEFIKKDNAKKIVTSRKLTLDDTSNIHKQKLLKKIAQRYTTCTNISYQKNNKQFISSTPERLISLHKGKLQVDAIGGTLSCTNNKNCIKLLNQESSFASKVLAEHAIIF